MKENKCIKIKTRVGYIVKAKSGEMEENKREGRTRRTRKDMVVYVQTVIGKNNFVVQFEDGKKGYMSASSLSYVFGK